MSLSGALARVNSIQAMVTPLTVPQQAAANADFSAMLKAAKATKPSQIAQLQKPLVPQHQLHIPPIFDTNNTSNGISKAAYQDPAPVVNGVLNQKAYGIRKNAAEWIAQKFDLKLTSGYRDPQHNAEVGGVPNSFHTKGLAFDLVGSAEKMQAAQAWMRERPHMFQEILIHDVGSGSHLHFAFHSG